MAGAFIVIEGGDGAGKDTQIELLQKEFAGSAVVYTREPGGTQLGNALRNMLLHETHGEVPPMTELFLFLADRAQHVYEVVLPSLLEGKTVISHRAWLSMFAYQIYGREQFDLKPLVKEAIDTIYKNCPADLTIVLDIDPAEGLKRQQSQGKPLDVIERLPIEVRERIRAGYLDTARQYEHMLVIDANRPVQEVYADVRAAVAQTIEKKKAADL